MQNTIPVSNINAIYRRFRMYINILHHNEKMCSRLTTFVKTLPGVTHSSANPVNGRILILYDEYVTSEYAIKLKINSYLNPLKSSIKEISNFNFKEEYALPIEIEKNTSLTTNGLKSPYHSLNINEIARQLGTDYDYGLSTSISQNRVKEYGLNVLSEKKRKSLLSKFIEGLNEFSTRLLLGAGFLSLLIGQIPEAIAITSIAIIETTISTLQQHKAENSLYSLKNMLIDKARVLRDGQIYQIDSKQLVPGDIIFVESGDKVPADARIIECYNLKTSEASLNGESTPIMKNTSICEKNICLSDRCNMIYMGTCVLSGTAKAVVVSTGMKTEIGKIASMLQNIDSEPTQLQIKMRKFTEKLTRICLGLSVFVGGISLISGKTIQQVLTTAIGFSLGAIPESLPGVVTITMALSVQKLTKQNAIVRNLSAVEGLSSVDVICCDKTGTLTMNQMTAKKIYVDGCTYTITGSGYSIEGSINQISGNKSDTYALNQLLISGVLCNNANLKYTNNKWCIDGDPTEAALLPLAYKANLDVEKIRHDYKRIKEIPFDSFKRYMTVIVKNNNEKIAYIKGAFSSISQKCTRIYENGDERLFTSSDKQKIQAICDSFAEDAMRVLAFGYKKLSRNSNDTENNFVFLGVIAMEDPPREGVLEAIQKCHKMNIKVVMITGDNKTTAKAIGKHLGILTDGIVVSGTDIDLMTDEELYEKIDKIQVFARTSPEQKHRIVKAFKKRGHIVAMTGDGVNDAPAIKEANIGIAMGKGGSDVAKDVASITLADDNFTTIVNAIEEGKKINLKIKSITKYLLAGSIGEIIAISLSTLTFGSMPFLALQLLWLNVIGESILGASLAMENIDDYPSSKLKSSQSYELLDRKVRTDIVKRSIGIGLTSFAIFEGSILSGRGISYAQSMAFTNLVLTQVLHVYDCRQSKLPSIHISLASSLSFASLLAILYIPSISSMFGTVALNPKDWMILSLTSSLSRI